MARAMDQDVLAPLLAVRWALRRVSNPPEGGLWPGLELLRQDQVVAEIDVVASDRGQLIFIEAKRSAGSASVRQLGRLVALARQVGASAACAAMNDTFSDAVRRFAERADLLLLERDVLLQRS